MRAVIFALSLILADTHAASWTTVWSNYTKQPPSEPTMIFVNMFVRSIRRVNSNDMSFDVQLTYREVWREPALAYTPDASQTANATYHRVDRKHIWAPDTFFANEISGHDFQLMSENSLVRVFPVGDILLSRRLQLKLSCPMNLKKFPLDTQRCHIRLASYGHATDQVIYLWKKLDPVQVTKNLALPGFTLVNYKTDFCTSKTNTGEYSCLFVEFTFEREWGPFVFKVFLPATMLVVLAYMTAWIKDATARAILLSVIFALALAGYCALSFALPTTSYLKAIDSFLIISLIFVFGIVVKFAVDWSRQRGFEKNESHKALNIFSSIWYPIVYILVVIICLSCDFRDA